MHVCISRPCCHSLRYCEKVLWFIHGHRVYFLCCKKFCVPYCSCVSVLFCIWHQVQKFYKIFMNIIVSVLRFYCDLILIVFQTRLAQSTPESVHQYYEEMLMGVREKANYSSQQLVLAAQMADQSIR